MEDYETPLATNNNLTRRERQILNNLQKRTDIIIKNSDKGDKIVVETKENYIKDGLIHLSDEEVYHRLITDINPEIHQHILKYLDHTLERGLIIQDMYQFLTANKDPRKPIIYFPKKLHKTSISVRPIVSNINSPTCQLSAFLDNLLKPLVNQHEQILKNSTQLINEIEANNFPTNSILVTADVKSLYPSIPIDESIEIIIGLIEKHNDPTYPPVIVIKTLLIFILKYNCFKFCSSFFLQVRGVAMGTKMAPNFANL